MPQNNLMQVVGILAVIALVVCLVMCILALIGGVKITDGCLLRYNFSEEGNTGGLSDSITNTVTLKASANYTMLNSTDAEGKPVLSLDPNRYGSWVNTNLSVKGEQKIKIKVTGDISLCQAYVPLNNIQSASNLDKDGNRIKIPRIEEPTEPISLIFDAKTDEWRNIAEIYRNDMVKVSVSPDRQGEISASTYDIFNKTAVTADCIQDKKTYSPICGRYSIWGSGSPYVNKCTWKSDCVWHCENGHCVMRGSGWDYWPGDPQTCSDASGDWKEDCWWIGCWITGYGTAPEAYKDNGEFTSPWSDDINSLFTNFTPDCAANSGNLTTYLSRRYFWFSANRDATGLLYRYDSTESVTNIKSRGSTYNFSKFLADQGYYANSKIKYKMILDQVSVNEKQYLQYRFHDMDGLFGDNNGGYVLNIKQTKCRRHNGEAITDVYSDRGRIQYMVIPLDENANNPPIAPRTINNLSLNSGEVELTIPGGSSGYMWMRILNDPNDYKDSFGQYQVQFFTSQAVGQFTLLILDPLFEQLKTRIRTAAESIFKNMICYNGGSNELSSCTNFFTYIKAILSLYIMLYGMMFLLGMVKINQTDLVIRVIKIAFVAGLMNEKTFNFFNTYVFDFVTGFADEIIGNMSGFSMFSTTNTIRNPFMFLDALMSKILFSKTFLGQILALISMGVAGLLYFILIFITLVIVIITILRAIAIYIMAFMAIAVLIGLAPLFLTFMLFDFTRYLFDNWVRFTFRYMLEPVVLMAGIIILTQLFTIYLDYAIGYSICWKCALPIKLPFPAIPGFSSALANIELFCINWFAPWGFDHRSGMMGVNMQHIIALVIIAYCIWGYADLSSKMVYKLTGTAGPSATQMGQTMSGAFEDKALKEVGLDKENRDRIKGEAKDRLKDRKKAVGEHNKEMTKTEKGGGKVDEATKNIPKK